MHAFDLICNRSLIALFRGANIIFACSLLIRGKVLVLKHTKMIVHSLAFPIKEWFSHSISGSSIYFYYCLYHEQTSIADVVFSCTRKK